MKRLLDYLFVWKITQNNYAEIKKKILRNKNEKNVKVYLKHFK